MTVGGGCAGDRPNVNGVLDNIPPGVFISLAALDRVRGVFGGLTDVTTGKSSSLAKALARLLVDFAAGWKSNAASNIGS